MGRSIYSRKDPTIKVITVVQVGNRRFSTAKAAAREYALHGCSRLWDKYRARYAALPDPGAENDFYWAVRERMIRRITPIFQRYLP